MSSRRRRKQKAGFVEGAPVELNVMPFIDVFSLLTTFLLFSAAFITIGILEVQIPFFSNKVEPSSNSERSFEVKLEASKEKLVVSTNYTTTPREEKSYDFENNEAGITEMHKQLYEIRSGNPEEDKITMFTEDDINYENLIKILDAVKFLAEGEAEIAKPGEDAPSAGSDSRKPKNAPLYPKVVMGDVILGKE